MKWISSQDELPSLNEEVWIHDKKEGVTIGTYSVIHGHGFWSTVYGDDDGLSDDKLYEVTHWMSMNRPDRLLRMAL